MPLMHADRGTEADLEGLAARGFWFDLKIDGIRALVTLRPGDTDGPPVSMTSRNGLDLTGRYPELVTALQELLDLPSPELVLDAEIAVPGPDGFPSWPLTHRRTAQRDKRAVVAAETPAVLYVFDVLRHRGHDLTAQPLRQRREVLETLSTTWPPQVTVTPVSSDPGALWAVVRRHGLEGVVAKNPESRYTGGRSRNWVKIKAVQTLTCLVGGVDWAPEARTEPRSLRLFLVDADSALVPVGKASAGVSPRLRPALLQGLRSPPLMVEVEYTQITPGRVLRNPVVRAIRTDVDVLDCSTDQLP